MGEGTPQIPAIPPPPPQDQRPHPGKLITIYLTYVLSQWPAALTPCRGHAASRHPFEDKTPSLREGLNLAQHRCILIQFEAFALQPYLQRINGFDSVLEHPRCEEGQSQFSYMQVDEMGPPKPAGDATKRNCLGNVGGRRARWITRLLFTIWTDTLTVKCSDILGQLHSRQGPNQSVHRKSNTHGVVGKVAHFSGLLHCLLRCKI